MAQMLQRLLGKPESLEAGQYAVVEHEQIAGFVRAVYVACPQCGAVDVLPRAITIESTGRLAPRWKCTGANCGWHDYLILDSWGVQ